MASSGRGGRGGGPGSRSGPMTLFQGSGLVYTEGEFQEEMDQDLVFEPATEMERVLAQKQLHLIQQQMDSAYWVRQPALRAEDREVPRYTDRYQPNRLGTGSVSCLLNTCPLNPGIFPPSLWANFTSKDSKRVGGEARRTRRATEINWDNLHAEENRTGDAEEDQRAKSDEDHHDEYEDEDEDDYAQNYFDNGEDDDEEIDDGGGGDEAAFD
ncbi:hypothetical protein MYAM1_002639 [Malassezia yamatoensis]|uniref:DNA-directed RNA polymerase III subunit n=1 Tax=Malassezia yamatoensis TaxID=253288 RepID=A0AAJ5YV63_9BASI|nr:hypothetical protein MYAM1_002639 [Malassezia yamatoensis]